MGCSCREWCFVALWGFPLIFYCFLLHSCAANKIVKGQHIRDGDQPLISPNQNFAFGFFSPDNSSASRYAGIWYNGLPLPSSVVWVANRGRPILDSKGVITFGDDGNLMVLDGNGASIWSTNVSVSPNTNSSVDLSDLGNLRLNSSRKVLWDSFSHPTDTFLPGMRVYVDDLNTEQRLFSSWKSEDDPSVGNFTMGIDPHRSPQILIWEGDNRHWRSGYWTGLIFTGVPTMRGAFLYGFFLNNDGGRRYFSYTKSNTSDLLKFRVTWDGHEEQERFNYGEMEWNVTQRLPTKECDKYNKCGAFGKCDPLSPTICSCLEKFEPKDPDAWSRNDWSGGCVRKTQLQCENNNSMIGARQENDGEPDGFVPIENVNLPDYLAYFGTEDITGCEQKCLENCSCIAYAFVSGINCMIWIGDLVDVQKFDGGGNTLYIRVAHSELGGKSKTIKLFIVVVAVVGLFFLILSIWLIWRRRAKVRAAATQSSLRSNNGVAKSDPSRPRPSFSAGLSTDFSGPDDLSVETQPGSCPELPLLSFNTLVAATNNFCDENKLGQGGFGHVYKGVLPGSQRIAVKRLSRKSSQGVDEFKNEITLIAKLQHRNLVRLLGCCVYGEEKMLVYEYMPNKSLDSFLFDSAKKVKLDWGMRLNIIEGIARGLLYLHRDSRLRIIHRDLKASNILLDEEMNPKISDFGMARIFGGNQNEANTNRVVGTYGYMAPEYAMEGLFSVKSDVYSFGILLLEIISGCRNTSYRSAEYSNIKGFAWDLWDRGRAAELIDPSLAGSCNPDEALRCIHIGMLCVQDSATHRPNMAAVVLMLESENAGLPVPRQPTFTSMRRASDEEVWHVSREIVSSNDVTMSAIFGR